MEKAIKYINNSKVIILGLVFCLVSCEKNKERQILLKNNINSENTILFTYNSNGIESILTTSENGQLYKSKDYLVKKEDGYYEDVDLVNNDSIRNYKKVLVKYKYDYSHEIPMPMPSFDGHVNVSIREIEPDRYLYTSKSGDTGIRFFYDGNYKIYKVVRILSPKDSLIYE